MRLAGSLLCLIAACGPKVPEEDTGDTGDASEADDAGSNAASGIEGGATSTNTSSSSGPGSATGSDPSATGADSGPVTTSADPSGMTDGDPSAADTSTTAGEAPVDPIVFTLAQAGVSGAETSAFAELEHFTPEPWDEAICKMAFPCDDNTAPEMGDAIFWVNGAWAPNGSGISVGDRVGLLFPFVDAECNLSCGGEDVWFEEPLGKTAGGGVSVTNFPCDTASTNVYLGVDFYQVDDPGAYVLHFLRVTDVCSAQGSGTASFDVAP